MTYEPENLKRWTRPDDWFGTPWPEHFVFLGRHRDSDCLAESNFECALKALGGESETVTIVRESHWAVGWVEWIAIHESDSTALETADAIAAALAEYPALDESDWNEREMEAANDVWRSCFDDRERVEYMKKNRDQFEFYNFADMLGCARGRYFAGYASDLLY